MFDMSVADSQWVAALRLVHGGEQGVATGLASTGQQVGSAIGLAVAALCTQIAVSATPHGFRPGIVIALAMGGGAVPLSGAIGRTRSIMRL